MARYSPLAALAAAIVGALIGALGGTIAPDPRWGLLGSTIVGLMAGVIGGWPLDGKGLNIELGHPVLNAAVSAAICAAGGHALLLVMAKYA